MINLIAINCIKKEELYIILNRRFLKVFSQNNLNIGCNMLDKNLSV